MVEVFNLLMSNTKEVDCRCKMSLGRRRSLGNRTVVVGYLAAPR